jgi:hypothetical protein
VDYLRGVRLSVGDTIYRIRECTGNVRGDVRGASAGNGRGASAARCMLCMHLYDVRYVCMLCGMCVCCAVCMYDVQVSYDIFGIFSKRLFSGVFGTTKTFECHFRAFYIVL